MTKFNLNILSFKYKFMHQYSTQHLVKVVDYLLFPVVHLGAED